jgi:hypothetical protein
VTYKLTDLDLSFSPHLPLQERVLDKLADILFASDEILDMIRSSERPLSFDEANIERSVDSIYQQVNELMKRLSD